MTPGESMPTSKELKPCPFCGSAPNSFGNDHPLWKLCRVMCSGSKCPAQASNFNTRAEAEAAWNNRASLSASPEPQGMEQALRRFGWDWERVQDCADDKPHSEAMAGERSGDPYIAKGQLAHILLACRALLLRRSCPNCQSVEACGCGEPNERTSYPASLPDVEAGLVPVSEHNDARFELTSWLTQVCRFDKDYQTAQELVDALLRAVVAPLEAKVKQATDNAASWYQRYEVQRQAHELSELGAQKAEAEISRLTAAHQTLREAATGWMEAKRKVSVIAEVGSPDADRVAYYKAEMELLRALLNYPEAK